VLSFFLRDTLAGCPLPEKLRVLEENPADVDSPEPLAAFPELFLEKARVEAVGNPFVEAHQFGVWSSLAFPLQGAAIQHPFQESEEDISGWRMVQGSPPVSENALAEAVIQTGEGGKEPDTDTVGSFYHRMGVRNPLETAGANAERRQGRGRGDTFGIERHGVDLRQLGLLQK